MDMIASTLLSQSVAELVGADATRLADPADAPKVTLIIDDFSPDPSTDPMTLMFATFTGSTPKSATAGAQAVGVDPLTNESIITLNEPVGGWRWECTADPATPETVYGFVVTDQAQAVLYGIQHLDEPVQISLAGHEINLQSLTYRCVLAPLG